MNTVSARKRTRDGVSSSDIWNVFGENNGKTPAETDEYIVRKSAIL
jgi:hypothetical protein